MATYYIHPETGNDANAGTSWAAPWRTTNHTLAAGDTVKVAKSPDPVSLGVNGTFTGPPDTLPTAKSITSSTNTSPIQVTVSSHGYSTGDVVIIYNHATNLTANGTWTITVVDANNFTLDGSTGIAAGSGGSCVKINHMAIKMSANPGIQTITRCEQAWTAANGSTVTKDTSYYREGVASAKIAMTSPAASTKYAYFTLPAALNLSSFQAITFWLRNDTAITAGQWKICLCSDTTGDIIVDTFPIPAVPSTGYFLPLTITRSGGGNLGSSIASIALYSDTSPGSNSGIYLDNILACQSPGLSLQSLITKDSQAIGITDGNYAIRHISEDGKIIVIDNLVHDNAVVGLTSRGYGYDGTSETVALYRRETLKTPLASALSTQVNPIINSGTSGYPITISGGWNPSTDTQDGETFIDGLTGLGYGIYASSQSYISISRISCVRYYDGVYFPAIDNFNVNLTNNLSCTDACVSLNGVFKSSITVSKINNVNFALYSSNYCSACNLNIAKIANNPAISILLSGLLSSVNLSFNNIINCTNYALQFGGGSSTFLRSRETANITGGSISYCTYPVYINYLSGRIRLYGINTDGRGTYGIYVSTVGSNYTEGLILEKCTINETTEVYIPSSCYDAVIYSTNHDNTADNHWAFYEGGYARTDASVVHTSPGLSWRICPTSTTRDANYPIRFKIASVLVKSGSQVTVSAWFRRDNTGLTMKLVVPANQIGGPSSQLEASMTAAANTWEQLSLSWTPSETGVVDVYAYVYGGTTYNGWVDDFNATQA